jgi:MFS family permease
MSPLAVLVLLGIANHSVLAGSRIAVSLQALSLGASSFTVGVLISLYALVPMFSAVPVGRLSDRIGVRTPMLAGSAGLMLGSALPWIVPGVPVLYVSSALVGTSFMAFQVASQHITGDLGETSERARNYSLLSLGYSISGFIGPISTGLVIDHFGFGAAFAVMTMVPMLSVAVLASGHPRLPRPSSPAGSIRHGGVRELLRHPTLRRVLLINALFSMSWDLHTVFVPIYGAKIELSASQIGFILSCFAAATFSIRLAMPVIMRYRSEEQVLTIALFVAAAAYLGFPFSRDLTMLAVLSFVLGLGLGTGQPVVMSLLHTHAPPGRMGEAAGVRMSLVQTMSVTVPLLFGALGSSIGVAPVFWSVSLLLGAGGVAARRTERRLR